MRKLPILFVLLLCTGCLPKVIRHSFSAGIFRDTRECNDNQLELRSPKPYEIYKRIGDAEVEPSWFHSVEKIDNALIKEGCKQGADFVELFPDYIPQTWLPDARSYGAKAVYYTVDFAAMIERDRRERMEREQQEKERIEQEKARKVKEEEEEKERIKESIRLQKLQKKIEVDIKEKVSIVSWYEYIENTEWSTEKGRYVTVTGDEIILKGTIKNYTKYIIDNIEIAIIVRDPDDKLAIHSGTYTYPNSIPSKSKDWFTPGSEYNLHKSWKNSVVISCKIISARARINESGLPDKYFYINVEE